MRYLLLILLILLGFITKTVCRPKTGQNIEESEGDEAEYENDEAETDDAIGDDDSRVAQEETAVDEQEENSGRCAHTQESNKNSHLQEVAELSNKNNENLSGYSSDKNIEDDVFYKSKVSNEYQSSSEQRDASRSLTKNLVDQPESRQLSNRYDNYKPVSDEKNPIEKRTLASQTVSNEEGDVLFEQNDNLPTRRERNNKKNYAVPGDAISQYRYSKQFYKSMQEGAPDKESKNTLERDRRAAQDTKDTIQTISASGMNEAMNNAAAGNAGTAVNTAASNTFTVTAVATDTTPSVADDEEAAIKRHVKKLSPTELNELLNSLSEDKRKLLKKIMDSDNESNDINKREITKKAGAAPDDNASLESGQSDASKLQEGCLLSEARFHNSENSENTKQQNEQPSDISVLPVSTSTEISNEKVETPNTVDAYNEAEIKAYNPLPNQSKINSKREVNSNQLQNTLNSSFDEYDDKLLDGEALNVFGDSGSRDEDLSEFDDEQSEPYNKQGNTLKRDASNESSDLIKSLEESFPNSYEDNNMTPLVRVKRKNLDMSIKKRAANIIPDAKVAYFPYRAENDDEDNDEGNEFDDDGFYNPTSNLAKRDRKDSISEDGSLNGFEDTAPKQKSDDKIIEPNLANPSKLNNKLEGETVSLGSDTDSVLSGGEGIDENLMYNSASRNKRAIVDADVAINGEESAKNPTIEQNRPVRSTAPENYDNDPNYREKDTFSPLPRNYKGDLSRYKRIKRVKLPSSAASQDCLKKD